MKANPKVIFFDLDKTIYDHRTSANESMRIMWERYRLREFDVSLEAFKDKLSEINGRLWLLLAPGKISIERLRVQRFEELLTHFSISGIDAATFGIDYIDAYVKQHHPMPGVDEFLSKLSTQYPLGILTNGFPDTQRKKLARLRWDNYFKWIVIAGEEELYKPDLRLFEHIIKLAGVEPNEIMYVGDSVLEDIVPARKAGLITVWIAQPGVDEPECDFVLDEAKQLWNLVAKD